MLRRAADRSFASLAWTSGGIASTPDDLAAIVRGVRDATLVTPSTLAHMMPRWPASGDWGERAVGLGLFRFELGGRAWIGRAGIFVGSEALAVWDEADGTMIVVMGNRTTFDAPRVAASLDRASLDAVMTTRGLT